MCLCDKSKVIRKMETSNNLRVSTGSRSGHKIIYNHPLCSMSSMVLPVLLAVIFAVGDFQTGKLFYQNYIIISLMFVYFKHQVNKTHSPGFSGAYIYLYTNKTEFYHKIIKNCHLHGKK